MNKFKTLGDLFLSRAKKTPEKNAIGKVNGEHIRFLSFKEYSLTAQRAAAGLLALGLQHQQKVAILSQTRIEWHLLDIASLCANGIVVPIYPNYTKEEIEWVLNHSESSFLICENEAQLNKLKNSQQVQKLKNVILIESEDVDLTAYQNFSIITYEELIRKGSEELKKDKMLVKDKVKEMKPDLVATIVYTSGTTGEPKGAVITHKAFLTMLSNISQTLKPQIGSEDRTLTFLPLSHVLGRCDSYLHLAFGLESVYAESIERLIDNLKIASPTIMIAVPRIFEKIFDKIHAKIEKEGHLKKATFKWACLVSKNYFDKIDRDLAPETSEIIQKNLAYKLVFKKVYEQFGGKIRFFVSGGAPLNKEIINFLKYANLTILEGYGLTETIAPCTLNPISKQVAGTVGLPLGDVEIQFEDDGEILVKSEALFSEYFKNPVATEKAMKGEFFRTGDIGELTSEGHLKITDRKKDIIITSGGKNIAPQKIESLAKLSPYISQFIVVGDQRKYLTALVAVEKEAFDNHLEEFGLDRHCSYSELANHPMIAHTVKKEIQDLNEKLARFEQIKDFYILKTEITEQSDYLTASLKIKKKKLLNDYEKEIDSLY